MRGENQFFMLRRHRQKKKTSKINNKYWVGVRSVQAGAGRQKINHVKLFPTLVQSFLPKIKKN
jgi:hypothetical protein